MMSDIEKRMKEYNNAVVVDCLKNVRPEYRMLAMYGGSILAVTKSKDDTLLYTTWDIEAYNDGVCHGHYFMDNYEGAKRDFAVRSGLVNSADVVTLIGKEYKNEYIEVNDHRGTWYVIDEVNIGGVDYCLLEHEEYGDEAAHVIVDKYGNLIMSGVYNGFDDLCEHLEYSIQQYQIDMEAEM